MELVVFLIFVYAATRAWKDSRAAYRKSKDAYTLSAEKRFPDAPESKRAALALRHDAGYWASQLGAGFPATRHGFAAGWHRGRTAQTSARTALEEARTRRLENQADHAEALSGFRERRQEAVRRWRAAVDSDAGRTTEGTVDGEGTPEGIRVSSGEWPQPRPGRSPWRRAQADGRGPGEGSAGSREGSPPATPEDDAAAEAGRTYSWGPADSPHGWPSGDDAAGAHRRARHASTEGKPYVVTVYPPRGGPGTTAATYLDGEKIEATDAQRAGWQAEAERVRRRYSTGWTGRPQQAAEGPEYGDCYLCGLPLGASDGNGVSHQRCEDVYARDNAAHEVRDDRDLEDVENGLREQGKCPHQIKPAGWDGGAIYCGQPITDTGGDRPDEFCLQHQAEADGDDEGAAQELNERVQELLERDARQGGHPANTQGTPSEGEQHMASDVTYDSVLQNMTAAKNVAENETAERLEAARNASAASEEMQALGVDPATLSAMADHLDAHDAAVKALQRVQETAETVETTMKRGHAGLAEAHANAPVTAAERPFYES